MNMEPTGTSVIFNHTPMATTLASSKWPDFLVKNMLAMVGANVKKYAENEWMGKKWETPQWEIDLSKRFNAALRHSVGCVKDKKDHFGLPCDEAGWVNVEHIMKYDHIWRDGYTLAGTSEPD